MKNKWHKANRNQTEMPFPFQTTKCSIPPFMRLNICEMFLEGKQMGRYNSNKDKGKTGCLNSDSQNITKMALFEELVSPLFVKII